MLAWLTRNRYRAQLSELLDGSLEPVGAARLHARLDRDPVLRAEYEALRQARAALAAWTPAPVPASFREDLDLSLALEAKPLRARYGELLDGSADSRLRAAVAADDELRDEFALLAGALDTWRAEPARPVPADFRLRLARRLDELEDRPVAVRPTRWVRVPRFALVGASTLLLFGLTVTRVGYTPDSHARGAAVRTPLVKSAGPVPSAVSAPVAAAPAHSTPAPAPVLVARAVSVAGPTSARTAAAHSARPTATTHPLPAVVATPAPRPAVTAEVPRVVTDSPGANEIPDPAVLNAPEGDAQPNIIVFASETPDEQF